MLENFFAGGDLKVKRVTSVKVGISILLLYIVLASPMVFFKVKFVQFLVSLLAIFSLTSSYLIPTLYKLKIEKPFTGKNTKPLADDDAQVDLDFGAPEQSVELGKHGKVMQNYFKPYQREGRRRPTARHGPSCCRKLMSAVLNSLLIGFIVCCYGLIVFNFCYHVVKPYLD